MRQQLLFFAMMLLPLVASAHDIEVANGDGVTIYYNYTNDGKELAVTFRGNSYNEYSDTYTGDVVIPDEVTYMNRTRKVTSIDVFSFYQCAGLTSVTIGNNVETIGENAFFGCPDLTSVIIGNSVTNIGNNAFYKCSSLTSVTMGNSVTSIGKGAFQNCSGLQKVIVSDIAAWCGIQFDSYDSNPLVYANHLYSDENTEIHDLVIPNGVTTIAKNAFDSCSGLTSVVIPNSVETISVESFYTCSGLTSVTIGNSVETISDEAFYACSGLTSIEIPNSVTSIGMAAFDGADITTVISRIENPFTITAKASDFRTFSQNTFNNATLYVPKGTVAAYKATIGWKDFYFIEESIEKCATPTIAIENGKLKFGCETDGVEFVYQIIAKGKSNEVSLGGVYTLSVYATKEGYEDSETVIKEIELGGMKGDMNEDGVLSVTDVGMLITKILEK